RKSLTSTRWTKALTRHIAPPERPPLDEPERAGQAEAGDRAAERDVRAAFHAGRRRRHGVRSPVRRAPVQAAAAPVHTAGCSENLPGSVRRAAGSVALPDP